MTQHILFPEERRLSMQRRVAGKHSEPAKVEFPVISLRSACEHSDGGCKVCRRMTYAQGPIRTRFGSLIAAGFCREHQSWVAI